MTFSSLTAISPIDGRYNNTTRPLSDYFSESAFIKFRVYIEIEYFIALCEENLPQLASVDKTKFPALREVYKNFSAEDALEIKEIEKTTNHDVKAVEYFIKKRFDVLGLTEFKEFIHFGLTSQDINNTAIPHAWKSAIIDCYLPQLEKVTSTLKDLATQWKEVPLLARTHGQAATPTLLGKELLVFLERLAKQLELMKQIPFSAKFGGATGNFNAHHVAYPTFNWTDFGNRFINKQLGLDRSQFTTQIEHYDNFAAHCDSFKRINTILIDLSRDLWTYISMDYFKQKIVTGQVGSSAMPHKVNPIDFENAEGNLGIANALFEHFSAKLPISRLQRDLSDSTVLRNIGVPLGHSLIAFNSIVRGLHKLILNQSAIQKDLEENWAVVAEAIQTILRREGYPNPYEALKDLTRTNSIINEQSILDFINSLSISEEVKEELKGITPWNYTGPIPNPADFSINCHIQD